MKLADPALSLYGYERISNAAVWKNSYFCILQSDGRVVYVRHIIRNVWKYWRSVVLPANNFVISIIVQMPIKYISDQMWSKLSTTNHRLQAIAKRIEEKTQTHTFANG